MPKIETIEMIRKRLNRALELADSVGASDDAGRQVAVAELRSCVLECRGLTLALAAALDGAVLR